MSVDDSGYRGAQRPESSGSDFNAQVFLIQSMLMRVRTATAVRVVAVTNDGGVSPVGFVDLVPMVNLVDGDGNAFKHATIFRCPYLRMQGGANAVILDPEVGDVGLAVFADRDISNVAATRDAAARDPVTPGSGGSHDMADGIYVGGMLNAVPTQFVQFSPAGIKLHSPTAIVLEAPAVQINATSVAITSSTLTHNGVNIGATHAHGGVQSGGSNTAVPH